MKLLASLVVLITVVFLGAENCFADNVSGASIITGERVIRTILSLVAVCALAVVILRKFGPTLEKKFKKSDESNETKKFTVVERVRLDKNHQLIVVFGGGSNSLLLGVGTEGIEHLGFVNKSGKFLLREEEDVADALLREAIAERSGEGYYKFLKN